jgi:hypothetical protein
MRTGVLCMSTCTSITNRNHRIGANCVPINKGTLRISLTYAPTSYSNLGTSVICAPIANGSHRHMHTSMVNTSLKIGINWASVANSDMRIGLMCAPIANSILRIGVT